MERGCPSTVQRPGDPNQNLREIRLDPPVVGLVGIGQCRARHFAAQAHVVEFAAHGPQARLSIPGCLSGVLAPRAIWFIMEKIRRGDAHVELYSSIDWTLERPARSRVFNAEQFDYYQA